MKIAFCCDHGGFIAKDAVFNYLQSKGYEIKDFGTNSDVSCDYPDYAFPAAESVASGECDYGILICGTGIGMSICANKVKGVRCALLVNETNAMLCHQHNNANVIALGSNDVSSRKAYKIIKAYDSVTFETRHQKRLDKISNYESK